MTTGSRREPGTCPVGHRTAQASSRSVTRANVTTGSTTGVSASEAIAAVPAGEAGLVPVPRCGRVRGGDDDAAGAGDGAVHAVGGRQRRHGARLEGVDRLVHGSGLRGDDDAVGAPRARAR